MTQLGYNLTSESNGPEALATHAERAEAAGFDFAMISDHYHPWISRQGHSPFVWGSLGAISERTDRLRLGTGVTCPTIRVHPAIIAQAAATAAVQLDGRFFFGVGTGERLNEHVLGDRWPPHHVRLEMLEEALSVIRELWSGGMHSHDGRHYTVENARVFTLPESPPPIHVSATGAKTAAAAAQFGDGLITTSPDESVAGAYRDAGGEGPRFGKVTVCVGETEAEARQTAREWWPTAAIDGAGVELPTPTHFEQVTKRVTEDEVAESIVTATDPEPHIERIEGYLDVGFDRVWIQQVGPDQEAFFDFYEREVLPRVA